MVQLDAVDAHFTAAGSVPQRPTHAGSAPCLVACCALHLDSQKVKQLQFRFIGVIRGTHSGADS